MKTKIDEVKNEMKTKIKSFAWAHADQVIASEIINEIDFK
jgi:hypothetical protein